MPEDTLQQFRTAYLDLARRTRTTDGGPDDTPDDDDEPDFELSLFSSALVDYDYIMRLLAKYTDAHKCLVGLIGVEVDARRHLHQQDVILVAILIGAWQLLTSYRHRRIAEVKRCTKQLIEFRLVLVDALNGKRLIVDTNSNLTAIGIGHSNDGNRQPLCINPYALAVKRLPLVAS